MKQTRRQRKKNKGKPHSLCNPMARTSVKHEQREAAELAREIGRKIAEKMLKEWRGVYICD